MVEAHGHAARFDRSTCTTTLASAERAFGRADPHRPRWLSYLDTAYMSAITAHCFRDLGDHKRASELAFDSLNMSEGYLRGRASICVYSRPASQPTTLAKLSISATRHSSWPARWSRSGPARTCVMSVPASHPTTRSPKWRNSVSG